MICSKCNKEFSPKVGEIHVKVCKMGQEETKKEKVVKKKTTSKKRKKVGDNYDKSNNELL